MLSLLQPVWATLLGGAGGIVGRLLPEVFDYFRANQKLEQAKADQAHERAMTDKQIELQKLAGQQRLEDIAVLADVEAVEGAVQVTRLAGIFFVDLLNGLVRPIVTYWYFGIYAAYKSVLIAGLFASHPDADAAWDAAKFVSTQAGYLWTGEDMAMLSGILNFWFMDRVFRHKAKTR